MKSRQDKKFIVFLSLLVFVRVAMALAAIYYFSRNGSSAKWLFYLGDEDEYFRLAFSLAGFNPVDSYRTLGFPLLLVPFIWLTRASSPQQLFFPLVVFHAFILGPASIVLVAFIAKKLAQGRRVALLSAAIWTIFPWLVYIFVHTNHSFCADVPVMRMAHQMWLQALSDPPSTFLVLLDIFLFLISLEKKGIIYPLSAGAFFGFACLIKPGNSGLVILFLSLYALRKQLKSVFLFFCGSFFMLLPQFIYNRHFYGCPFKFSTLLATERSYACRLSQLVNYPLGAFAVRNYFFSFREIILKFPPGFLFSVFILVLIMIYTLFWLYGRSRGAALIITLWVSPYLFIYGSISNFYDSILHFLMPVVPALIIIVSIALNRCIKFDR